MGKGNSKLNQDELNQLVSETNLTEEEVQRCYAKFKSDFPDGKITVERLKALYGIFFPKGESYRFANIVFRAYDTNRDGSVDFREFLQGLSVTRRGTPTEKVKWLFSMYDLDSDGFISKDEMLEVISAIFKMVGSKDEDDPEDEQTPYECMEKIFEQMDTNEDGQISLNEFISGIKKNPTLESLLQSPHGCLAKDMDTDDLEYAEEQGPSKDKSKKKK